MKLHRHKARELAMQILFCWEFQEVENVSLDACIAYVLHDVEGYEEGAESDFLKELLAGITKHRDVLVSMIVRYAPEWPLDKINPVDRAILYIGLYEVLYASEVPKVVAINEAIEVAKKFGNKSSPKFINGVLNSVMKSEEDFRDL